MSESRQNSSRLNGAKSNGPVTVEGKARVSENAIKHGLLAKAIVLRWESQELFEAFQRSYMERYQPADDAEYLLVEEIIAAKWRLRRLWACENRLLSFETDRMEADLKDKFENMDIATRVALAYKENCDNSRAMSNLQRHEARLSREARLADKQLRELQAVRKPCPEPPATQNLQNKPEECPPVPPTPAIPFRKPVLLRSLDSELPETGGENDVHHHLR